MFFPRAILPQLEQEIEMKGIVVLTGMRQVGKTTLLTHLYDRVPSGNKAYFDAENPLHRKLFEEEHYDNIVRNLAPFGVTTREKAYIFIDEVQHLPMLTSAAKYLHDHYNVKLFLTGSSSFYLKNLFPESLAGRKVVFELHPLTFAEFLTFRGVERSVAEAWREKALQKREVSFHLYEKEYAEYMRHGGFPAVVLEQDPLRKRRRIEEIFTSYFEHDVKSLADFRDISKLRDLLLLLAPRTGSKLDITKLSSELAVSRETVYAYLGFLEQTYVIRLLPRHSASADRRAAGSRKVYFGDTGLAQAFGSLSEGQILEHAVLQSLWPHHAIRYFSAKRSGRKIDFVVDGTVALEVKTSATSGDGARLRRTADAAGIAERYLLCRRWSNQPDVILAQDL